MRVNVYAEEITDRVELITKTTKDGSFTGVRFWLELPVTVPITARETVSGEHDKPREIGYTEYRGPFKHHPDDDDSSAVTFWGKQDMRDVLRKALRLLDDHYAAREQLKIE